MLDAPIQMLAHGANFAAFTVLLSSGQPMTNIMWVDATDEHVVINTETHRLKYRAVEQDPRVAVAIWDVQQPYRYGEVRGKVVETITGPEARAHIDVLAQKYTGQNYDPSAISSERVILRIAPDKQRTWGF